MFFSKELNKNFESREEMIKELIINKSTIIAQKKSILKKADAVSFAMSEPFMKEEGVIKSNEPISDIENINEITILVAINTTNLIDGHMDLHLPNLWKKSIQENKSILFLQEHEMKFDKIIADGNDLKVSAKYITWTELGFPYEGKTQVLLFKAKIKRNRNTFMFNQYANGYVKQHSVGMAYVKIELAVNDEDSAEEYVVWKKYYDKIANKNVADEEGYFFAVTEAKVREGSSVTLGSNFATPTIENNKNESEYSTHKEIEPSIDTQKDFYLKMNLKN